MEEKPAPVDRTRRLEVSRDETIGQLLAGNPVFVRLMLGQVVSMAGDWICYVALLALLLEVTGSAWSVSLLLALSSLMALLVMPLAGVVADRFDRRRVLIAADLVRMALTLGYLLVRGPGDAWLALLIAVINVAASNFFGPAASAALPNVVSPRQLAAANGLMGAVSGLMLAVGAAAGSLVSSAWGRDTAFVVDALSFLVSAVTIASVRIPFSVPVGGGPFSEPEEEAPGLVRRVLRDLAEACGYVGRHRGVQAILLVKAAIGLGGGVLTLLSVMPMQVFKAGDRGVGLLYTSRGLGSIVGAILAPQCVRDAPLAKASLAATGLVIAGGACVAFATSSTLAWAFFCVLLAYLGSSLPFVFTSVLLQEQVDDAVLGRVFALDNAILMVTAAASTLLCGWGMDVLGPRTVGVVAGVALAVLGIAWLAWYRVVRPLELERPSR